MEIFLANIKDAEQILSLQKLSYQSEAAIYQDFSIPPLVQTIQEIKEELKNQFFLKALDEKGKIIGSVRACYENESCFVGRLIVHPECQGKGVGTMLMNAIENYFASAQRYELFTGTKSIKNIRLYKKLGYKPFKEQVVNEFLSLIYLEKTKIASQSAD